MHFDKMKKNMLIYITVNNFNEQLHYWWKY